MKVRAIALAPMVVLAGCGAHTVRDSTREPYAAAAATCVRSVKQLDPHPVPPLDRRGNAIRLPFRSTAQCLLTDDIAEPVALFQLPESRPLAVRVASHVVDTNVLAVSAHLLDGRFQPIASTGFDRFTQRDDGYVLTTFVNADLAGPAYLLLRPDKAWHDREVELVTGQRWSTVWIAPTVMGTYSDGTERIERLTFSDAGDITLRVEPYRRGDMQSSGR